MKRLPLTFEERQFFKAVEKTAVVLMIMFRIHPVPINTETLAYEMKWDARTAEKYLESLASDNLTILLKGQGYVLTGETRRLIAQFFGQILSIPLEALALAQESQVQALDPEALESGKESQLRLTALPESVKAGYEVAHTVCALEVEEESLNLKDSNSSSTTKNAQNVCPTPDLTSGPFPNARREKLPSVAQILAATPILFGDPGVLTAGLVLNAVEPRMALGWVAQAYDQRQSASRPRGLRSPAGLVHSRLADAKQPKPQSKYLDAPQRYLPNEYLERLGLSIYRCVDCGQEFSQQADSDIHMETEHPPEPETAAPDETVTQRLDGHMSAQQAWQAILGQLQMEMPKASFDTWVRDTQPIHYGDNVLTIGAANAFARDWLESRLSSTVSRLLVGIMNAEVQIRFVTADFGEQNDQQEA